MVEVVPFSNPLSASLVVSNHSLVTFFFLQKSTTRSLHSSIFCLFTAWNIVPWLLSRWHGATSQGYSALIHPLHSSKERAVNVSRTGMQILICCIYRCAYFLCVHVLSRKLRKLLGLMPIFFLIFFLALLSLAAAPNKKNVQMT